MGLGVSFGISLVCCHSVIKSKNEQHKNGWDFNIVIRVQIIALGRYLSRPKLFCFFLQFLGEEWGKGKVQRWVRQQVFHSFFVFYIVSGFRKSIAGLKLNPSSVPLSWD